MARLASISSFRRRSRWASALALWIYLQAGLVDVLEIQGESWCWQEKVRLLMVADMERAGATYVFNEGTLVLEGVTFAEMVPVGTCVRD